MIAIDTNVLLRYLLNDHEEQSGIAEALILGNRQVLITDVVLAETVWTLRGRKYKVDDSGIAMALNSLFSESSIIFEDDEVIWKALVDYVNANEIDTPGQRKHVDFADTLIINKAKMLATDSNEPFGGFHTFDLAASTLPGASRL